MNIKDILKGEKKLNHEIRFHCSRETKKRANEHFLEYFQDQLKKKEFLRLVFIRGLEGLERDIFEKKQEKNPNNLLQGGDG